MSFLPKPLNKTLYSLSILRRFATAIAAKPLPADPTSAYYDELATAAGSSGDLNALRDLLNKRIQDGFFNTKRTFSFITEPTFSPSLLNDVVQTISSLDTTVARKNAFDCLVARLCKLHRIDDALRVVESMPRDADCDPRACTFYPILSYLTRQKSLDDARRVVDLMATLGLRMDLTCHNYFVSAHCYAGDLASAAAALRKIEEEGFSADNRTFDALVLGACRTGRVDAALVLVRRMISDGVAILFSTHMSVIEALLKMKCYDLAVRYVRGFSGKDNALDTEIFGFLGIWLLRLNKVDEAVAVLEEMNQRGLPMGSKLKKFYERRALNDKGGKKKNDKVEKSCG